MRKLIIASLIALLPGLCAAETAFVQEFDLAQQEVAVSCDIERLLEKAFLERGMDLVRPSQTIVPDLVVTGTYRNKGSRVYATVTIADTVGARTAYSASLLMPMEERNCGELISRITADLDGVENSSRKTFQDPDSGVRFVLVPGGSFRMSAGEGSSTAYVAVGSFFMGDREVTQGQYRKVMGFNPSFFKGDDLPVENVSWYDAIEYIRLLNERTGRVYRLPTEAEWEYAASAKGRNFKWSGTNQRPNLEHFAWTSANSEQRTHPAGTLRPNGLGLYDMSGNVWEWTSDRYVRDSGKGKMGTPSVSRVIKGGSWMMDEVHAALSNRDSSAPETRYQDNGFRLVLEVMTPKPEVATKRNQPRGEMTARQ